MNKSNITNKSPSLHLPLIDECQILFDVVDFGVAIVEAQRDRTGEITDLVFRHVNQSFETHTGLTDVIDKKASELSPNLLATILQYARKAAAFPTLVRVEQHIHSLGRWFDASYVKIGDDSDANIAILFKDITQVKIYQRNQSFLSEITRDLVMLRNIRNGLDELAEKIAKHFDVPWCSFAEIIDDRTTAVANYGWNADFVPSLKGIYDTEELWSREEAERMNNGQASVACDTFNDSRFNAKNFAALGVRSFIAVPLAKDGKFNSLLSIIDIKTRQWTAEDLAIMQELVSRIWARIELARAEEILQDSELHLRQLLKQKDEFIGVAGHELKTPVTSMKIFGELVQQRLEETENKDDINLITKLNAQIKRLTLLINHLLDATKIAEGQLRFNFQNFDLNALLHERIDEVQKTTNHKLEIHTGDLKLICGDRERVWQVLLNLLSNAVKYSKAGTTVIITTQGEKNGARVSVRDEGSGIPEDSIKRIFDRYYRVADGEMNAYPGMGLGLHIALQIIEKHGGKIWAESKVGEGSTFIFTIPYKRPRTK